MIEKLIIGIQNTLCTFLTCNQDILNEYSLIEEILKIKFNEINRLKTDCFHIDELKYFLRDITFCTDEQVEELLTQIFIKKYIPNQALDIKKITTIQNSKSEAWGYSYESIYLFGDSLIKSDIKYASWPFEQLINQVLDRHRNNLVINYYSWLNQYEWSNDDASHRFALAIYHAYENNIDYDIDVSITAYEMNVDNLKKLLGQYELFILNTNILYKITNLIPNKETYVTCELIDENAIIGFDKSNFYSGKIIELFKKYDQKFILNFNSYVENLLSNQEKFKSNKH